MPNPILAGGYPFFQNFVGLNVAVTLTFTNTAPGVGAAIAVAPAGSAIPFTDASANLFNVYQGQTVTVSFDVPDGGFICNTNGVGLQTNFTYQVENIIDGRAP